jgi:molybdenum cofactor cytidylyltransferase
MGGIAIAILAAGGSSRFNRDYPKSLALLRGRSLLSYSLEAALHSTLTPVILVVGHCAQQIIPLVPSNVTVLYNAEWQRGISSSLQTALRSLETDRSINAICVGLADQPYIGAESYHRLAKAYQEGASLAAATYQGARRNPVLLARSMWTEAMSLTGDEGAKQLMRIHPAVEVPCDDTGNSIDVDTLDDLIMLEQDIAAFKRVLHQF